MTKRAPWLVVVGAGPWQRHGIRCAQEAGLQVLAIDGDTMTPGLVLAEQALDKVGIPLIVKPVDSAGSRGGSRIDSRAELRQAFDEALSHSARGRGRFQCI